MFTSRFVGFEKESRKFGSEYLVWYPWYGMISCKFESFILKCRPSLCKKDRLRHPYPAGCCNVRLQQPMAFSAGLQTVGSAQLVNKVVAPCDFSNLCSLRRGQYGLNKLTSAYDDKYTSLSEGKAWEGLHFGL